MKCVKSWHNKFVEIFLFWVWFIFIAFDNFFSLKFQSWDFPFLSSLIFWLKICDTLWKKLFFFFLFKSFLTLFLWEVVVNCEPSKKKQKQKKGEEAIRDFLCVYELEGGVTFWLKKKIWTLERFQSYTMWDLCYLCFGCFLTTIAATQLPTLSLWFISTWYGSILLPTSLNFVSIHLLLN